VGNLSVKLEIIEKIAALITAAFGLIAALAWNTAIQAWFAEQTYLASGGPWIYAIVITIIAVILTIWIGRIAGKLTKKEADAAQKVEDAKKA
jgi:TRAP-type C4-dicarboxylate transport system permease small subunit